MSPLEYSDDGCNGRDVSAWSQYNALQEREPFVVDGKQYVKINDVSCVNDQEIVIAVRDVLEKCRFIVPGPLAEDIRDDTSTDPEGEGNPYYLSYLDLKPGEIFTLETVPGFIFVKQDNQKCVKVRVDDHGGIIEDFGEDVRAAEICTESLCKWGDTLVSDDGLFPDAIVTGGDQAIDISEIDALYAEDSPSTYRISQSRIARYLPDEIVRNRSQYERLMNDDDSLLN